MGDPEASDAEQTLAQPEAAAPPAPEPPQAEAVAPPPETAVETPPQPEATGETAAPSETPAPPAAEQAPAAPDAAPRPAPRDGDGPRERRERPGDGERRRGGGGRRFGRRRVCAFCVEKVQGIDYKDPGKLRRYLSDRARIEPRRKTGTCAKHQRWLTTALKRARHLALLPYTPGHIRQTGMFSPRR